MDKKEFLERYQAGQRDFSGIDLTGIELTDFKNNYKFSDINLNGANLTNAKLEFVNFTNVNLANANLAEAEIACCDFNYANFSNANLTDVIIDLSNFIEANFHNANLTNIYVKYCPKDLCDFSRANFSRANCSNALLICNLSDSIFKDTNLNGIRFRLSDFLFGGNKTQLNNIDFSDCNFSGVDFATVDLTGVNLTGANLSHTNFYEADLINAKLKNANLTNANLTDAKLKNANLTNANLTDANLSNAYLQGADLEGANLTKAILTKADLRNANLDNADLTDATINRIHWRRLKINKIKNLPQKAYLVWQLMNLGGVNQDLSGVDLSDENLDYINLEGANLTESNFSDSDLSKASLNNANLSKANLRRSDLYEAYLCNSNLTEASLNTARLNFAKLSNANLTKTNLTNSSLFAVDFTGIDFSSVNITNADFDLARIKDAINIPENIKLFHSPIPKGNPSIELYENLCGKIDGKEMVSVNDYYPFEVSLWNTKEKGDFSLEYKLKREHQLKIIDLESFWQQLPDNNLNTEQQFIHAYQTLLKSIQVHIDNLEIYQISTEELVEDSDALAYIIFAKTKTDDWLAISTALSGIWKQDSNSSLIFDIRDFALSKPDNQELVLAIEKAIDKANTLIPSRNDVSHFVWEIAENRNSVFLNLLVKTKYFTIQEYFYDNEDEEHEDIFEFDESTTQLVNTELTNLRYYFFGSVFMDVYLVGETKYGDWISIKSTVVEYFQ